MHTAATALAKTLPMVFIFRMTLVLTAFIIFLTALTGKFKTTGKFLLINDNLLLVGSHKLHVL